jgi:DNA-binding LacI/PurR family transcriptional regulator
MEPLPRRFWSAEAGDRRLRGATIAKVAQHAGVGVGTVSRVLNGSPAVSESTRRRVLDSIAALDYRPNPVARALSTGRTMAVGVVAPFFTQPSVVERLRGAARALSAAGYQVVLFDVETPEQARERLVTRALRGRIDAALCVSLAPGDAEAAQLEVARVPIVLIDRAHPRLPCITIDDVEGGRMAARHLLGLGHRRIAFVGDAEENRFGFDSSARRRAGFEEELAAAGVPLDRELRLLRPHGQAAARAAAAELLAGERPPTAVFAGSDVQAIGVLEAAQAAGVSVPGELSVVGFDNIEAAGYTGLTTIAQPLEESGAVGAALLLRALAGEVVTGRRMSLELVDRGSTGPSALALRATGVATADQ